MNKLLKPSLVFAGYVAAFFAACVAVYVRQLQTQDEWAQASAGMYAFGDFLLFVAVFGVLSLIPTALALYYLRPYKAFWTVLSIGALTAAITGPVAAFTMQRFQSTSDIGGLLCCLQVTAAPLLALGFLTCSVLAPSRRPQWTLLAAALGEGVVTGYAFLCLFVLQHWL